MKTYKYNLINYFDVWNEGEENGIPTWQVNNLCKEEDIIELSENYNHKEIIEQLQECDFLSGLATIKTVEFYDDFEMIELFDKTNDNYPICRLELIRD